MNTEKNGVETENELQTNNTSNETFIGRRIEVVFSCQMYFNHFYVLLRNILFTVGKYIYIYCPFRK